MTVEQRSMFDSPLAKAREFKSRRRYDAALDVLLKALESNPDDLKLKASLADLYYRMARYRKALSLAGAILRDVPDDPRALVVMGNALLARGKPDEAREYFELAIKVAPTDYVWGRVARCHLTRNQPREALNALNQAEGLAPPTAGLLGIRASCFRLLDEREAERQTLLRAARAAPSDPEGYFSHAWILLSDLSPKIAVGVSALLREFPGQELNPHLLLFEAEASIKIRDRDTARQRLDQLMAQDPPEGVLEAARNITSRLGPQSDSGEEGQAQ